MAPKRRKLTHNAADDGNGSDPTQTLLAPLRARQDALAILPFELWRMIIAEYLQMDSFTDSCCLFQRARLACVCKTFAAILDACTPLPVYDKKQFRAAECTLPLTQVGFVGFSADRLLRTAYTLCYPSFQHVTAIYGIAAEVVVATRYMFDWGRITSIRFTPCSSNVQDGAFFARALQVLDACKLKKLSFSFSPNQQTTLEALHIERFKALADLDIYATDVPDAEGAMALVREVARHSHMWADAAICKFNLSVVGSTAFRIENTDPLERYDWNDAFCRKLDRLGISECVAFNFPLQRCARLRCLAISQLEWRPHAVTHCSLAGATLPSLERLLLNVACRFENNDIGTFAPNLVDFRFVRWGFLNVDSNTAEMLQSIARLKHIQTLVFHGIRNSWVDFSKNRTIREFHVKNFYWTARSAATVQTVPVGVDFLRISASCINGDDVDEPIDLRVLTALKWLVITDAHMLAADMGARACELRIANSVSIIELQTHVPDVDFNVKFPPIVQERIHPHLTFIVRLPGCKVPSRKRWHSKKIRAPNVKSSSGRLGKDYFMVLEPS